MISYFDSVKVENDINFVYTNSGFFKRTLQVVAMSSIFLNTIYKPL